MFKKFFSPLRAYEQYVKDINALEEQISGLSDEQIKQKSIDLGDRIRKEEGDIEREIPEAFALVREAARRTLSQRHYDVQLIGGAALAKGRIVEMATGEGKTLAATAPVYLHALTKKGSHVITVNDYLAQRDAVWMGQIYDFLGCSVACITHEGAYIYDPLYTSASRAKEVSQDQKEDAQTSEKSESLDEERDEVGSFKVVHEFLRPVSRKEAYEADIVYGTNHEFGFDYLRDNLAYDPSQQVQREHYFAVIDEVDSILIDEARTPLIISAPDTQAAEFYKLFARLVAPLERDKDYSVDEKLRSVEITDEGIEKIEKALGVENLYDPQNIKLVHYLEESLKAKALFSKDRQYVVSQKNGQGEIIIVDEFTGRLMHGRRFSGGLHQAIEAKEGVRVQEESKTFAQITIQNYFRLYDRVSGMTGTAKTSAEEFEKVYGLEVIEIPTHRPKIRKDLPDLVFKTTEAKYTALVKEVKERSEKGQPILLGTTSIDENELLSDRFLRAGIRHEVLNAKNHEREGEIIAQAGRKGSVTLATNMAGRGVDIVLGGNPSDPLEAEEIKNLGGLCVLGTQRHDSRRIDNQLRGRSGRQGDPGETRFFLSLEDEMLRIFGGERVQTLMTRFNLPEDQPIESSIIGKLINEAQKKVEGIHFDMRKHLLEYDDVLDKQRRAVYRRRQNILVRASQGNTKEVIMEMLQETAQKVCEIARAAEQQPQDIYDQEKKIPDAYERIQKWIIETEIETDKEKLTNDTVDHFCEGEFSEDIKKNIEAIAADPSAGAKILSSFDVFWTNHLENLDALRESVRMRAYGQKDPLVEYKRESHQLFRDLITNAQLWVVSNIFKAGYRAQESEVVAQKKKSQDGDQHKVGRNDPCWCGSGKKYKKCHGA